VSAGADDLRKVYVEPTNACNLNCKICVRHAWDELEGFMEWPTFEAAVDGLVGAAGDGEGDAATGPQAAGTVAFMGLGEPLQHSRFLDMVRLVKSRGLRAEVTTNALLLDDETAGGLLRAGLDQLMVSIDGASAEAFGRVRSGAFLAKVVENVRRLHDRRGPNCGLGCASASSSWRCAPASASCRGSIGSPPNWAPPSSSSAMCSPSRPSSKRRRSTTSA
jgi:MoaA/NifB/PqqE/SkfB family radical SAM enzyme